MNRLTKTHGLNILRKYQSKDKHFEAQMKRVFSCFAKQPKSMLMVEVETNIMRSNICWYVNKWEKQNRIMKIKKGICKVSKRSVGFYTTNKDLFIQPSKLS